MTAKPQIDYGFYLATIHFRPHAKRQTNAITFPARNDEELIPQVMRVLERQKNVKGWKKRFATHVTVETRININKRL